MRSVRYALASLFYYKKNSLITIVFFSIFLFISTLFLNLIDINNSISKKIQQYPLPHFKLNQLIYHFSLGHGILILLFLLIFSIYLKFIFKKRQQDFLNWQLMGFSTPYIFLQFFLEFFLVLLASTLLVLLILIFFQQFYETLLLKSNDFFTDYPRSQFADIFLRTNENVPLTSQPNFQVIDFEFYSFSEPYIQIALLKNAGSLLLLGTITSFLGFYIMKFTSKKSTGDEHYAGL